MDSVQRSPRSVRLRLSRLQLRYRCRQPGRLYPDRALQSVSLLRPRLRSAHRLWSAAARLLRRRRHPLRPAVTLGASFGRFGWFGAGFGWGAHTLLIDHRPWTRTYVNRGAYVHPYAHPYVRPAAPRVEHHPAAAAPRARSRKKIAFRPRQLPGTRLLQRCECSCAHWRILLTSHFIGLASRFRSGSSPVRSPP